MNPLSTALQWICFLCAQATVISLTCTYLVLHPVYKLQHFKDQNWLEEWVTVAEELVHDEWVENYKPKPTRTNNACRMAKLTAHTTQQLFASLSGGANTLTTDVLEDYLKSPVNKSITDPLKYWNTLLQSEHDCPLAQMALDFLLIPGKSSFTGALQYS
ncbi:hypothetical protein BD311DRAFT_675362 [Dichomitus squalens]|uniref:HAT C-terminal dimerisation domain-containing protein n=1 Tax=Dichomitus squalens TaxID=114155 RepID=A0A4Q9M6W9_9APHY|nr:hypothetical protein BD311DRAFT_675362 [Dichomitus squalens]